MLPPAVFWWPLTAAGGATSDAQNTILAAMLSIIHPDHGEYLPMLGEYGNLTAHDVLARSSQTWLNIFALVAEDGLSAIQSFQILQDLSRMAQMDPSVKSALAGRRAALIFSSSRNAQPNLTLENQLMPLLKKCGMIYTGSYWHYAGAHPGWRLQNAPKAAAFRGRIESELAMINAQIAANSPTVAAWNIAVGE